MLAEFQARAARAAASAGCGPASTSRPSGACPFGTVGDRHPVLPGPARPDRPPRRARPATSRGSAAATSCATSATRWGTSSTTPTGSTTSEEWVEQFGSITQPYREEYRPEPFSRRYVRHLPGWYAQKHPDEDWAETFAVWMTPGLDWRAEYADWPDGAGQARVSATGRCQRLADREPLVTDARPRRGRGRDRRTRSTSITGTIPLSSAICRRDWTARCARSSRTWETATGKAWKKRCAGRPAHSPARARAADRRLPLDWALSGADSRAPALSGRQGGAPSAGLSRVAGNHGHRGHHDARHRRSR